MASAYNILITNLISRVGTINVPYRMTQHFAGVIESKRALHSIKTLEQLIKTLEVRDEISETDVSVLRSIFVNFKEASNNNAIFESICNLIDNYKTLQQTGGKEGKCAICTVPLQSRLLPCEEYVVPVAAMAKLTVEDETEKCPEKKDDSKVLMSAIMEIEDRLSGADWTRLGRVLGVDDYQLKILIDQRHTRPHSETVHEMFILWIQANGNNATLEVLVKALRHSLIRRVDLAQKLEEQFGLY